VAPKYSRHFTQIPTDGQTDRQTNTFLIASPRWDSMQRGKKEKIRILWRQLWKFVTHFSTFNRPNNAMDDVAVTGASSSSCCRDEMSGEREQNAIGHRVTRKLRQRVARGSDNESATRTAPRPQPRTYCSRDKHTGQAIVTLRPHKVENLRCTWTSCAV